MKNLITARIAPLFGIIAIIVVIGFSMVSCGDGSNSDDEISRPVNSVTYESSSGGDVYVLVISEDTGRAVYSAKTGDPYVLKLYQSSGTTKTTSGKVTSITSVQIVLAAPSPITVTLNSEDKMTALVTSTAKIKWGDNTETVAPATLVPVIEDAGLSISNGVLTKYTGNGASVTIPHRVTIIGHDAFSGCDNLASVTIPNSVTSIEWCAFSGCDNLASVPIPASVTSIGVGILADCSSLTEITVNSANTAYVSDNGVLYNKAKTTLLQYPAGKTGTTFTIPSTVTNIEWGVFYGCANLTSVTIGNSVTSIGAEAFNSCTSLASITIGNSVTSIGFSAFWLCESLTSVTIPASVTSIGGAAFHCNNLTSVIFATGSHIVADNFGSIFYDGDEDHPYLETPFRGDLREKYLASNGGAGTYTRSGTAPAYTWTKS